MTPPLKPYLEEKLWLALFWSRPLQEFWRQEIGEKGQKLLQAHHSVFVGARSRPATDSRGHSRAGHSVLGGDGSSFSQKQRDLVLKISGFSELAWGARGVDVGSATCRRRNGPRKSGPGLAEFATRIRGCCMRFAKGALAKQDYVA